MCVVVVLYCVIMHFDCPHTTYTYIQIQDYEYIHIYIHTTGIRLEPGNGKIRIFPVLFPGFGRVLVPFSRSLFFENFVIRVIRVRVRY